MEFDFSRFSEITSSAYREGNPYTLDECLEVFRQYFQAYEKHTGHPHPPVKREQIANMMLVMPAEGWYIPNGREIDPEEYPNIINLHFKTRYRRCDYNINHFFSGRIRELRRYESDVGYI